MAAIEENPKKKKEELTRGILLLTRDHFVDLMLSVRTLKALRDSGFHYMTQIQARSIRLLLEGKDVRASARTGSGKTLAFMVPAVEILHRITITPQKGPGVIVVCPTSELASQVYDGAFLFHLKKYRSLKLRLLRNDLGEVDLLVATPGQLLCHLQKAEGFTYENLKFLVIDDADRILEANLEETIRKIIEFLPKVRQTALFSATKLKEEDLARFSFQETFVCIDMDYKREREDAHLSSQTTPDHVDDNEVTKEGEPRIYKSVSVGKRFNFLCCFLKQNQSKKVIVILANRECVLLYSKLLKAANIVCLVSYEELEPFERTAALKRFSAADKGILLTSDAACRRVGVLNALKADWVVQSGPPADGQGYVRIRKIM